MQKARPAAQLGLTYIGPCLGQPHYHVPKAMAWGIEEELGRETHRKEGIQSLAQTMVCALCPWELPN